MRSYREGERVTVPGSNAGNGLPNLVFVRAGGSSYIRITSPRGELAPGETIRFSAATIGERGRSFDWTVQYDEGPVEPLLAAASGILTLPYVEHTAVATFSVTAKQADGSILGTKRAEFTIRNRATVTLHSPVAGTQIEAGSTVPFAFEARDMAGTPVHPVDVSWETSRTGEEWEPLVLDNLGNLTVPETEGPLLVRATYPETDERLRTEIRELAVVEQAKPVVVLFGSHTGTAERILELGQDTEPFRVETVAPWPGQEGTESGETGENTEGPSIVEYRRADEQGLPTGADNHGSTGADSAEARSRASANAGADSEATDSAEARSRAPAAPEELPPFRSFWVYVGGGRPLPASTTVLTDGDAVAVATGSGRFAVRMLFGPLGPRQLVETEVGETTVALSSNRYIDTVRIATAETVADEGYIIVRPRTDAPLMGVWIEKLAPDDPPVPSTSETLRGVWVLPTHHGGRR
jgi:hypothetical protein